MRTGTHHFKSLGAAIQYYASQGESLQAVLGKIAEGQITIGKPALKPGESLTIIPGEGRYAIEDNKP